jgi:hypothetical protein
MDARFPKIKGAIMKFYFLFIGDALIEVANTHVYTAFWVVWHEDAREKTANPIACAVSRATVSQGATARLAQHSFACPLSIAPLPTVYRLPFAVYRPPIKKAPE